IIWDLQNIKPKLLGWIQRYLANNNYLVTWLVYLHALHVSSLHGGIIFLPGNFSNDHLPEKMASIDIPSALTVYYFVSSSSAMTMIFGPGAKKKMVHLVWIGLGSKLYNNTRYRNKEHVFHAGNQ
ncbi:hypothetical protein ACJX0J_014491, partial [Zea mays]